MKLDTAREDQWQNKALQYSNQNASQTRKPEGSGLIDLAGRTFLSPQQNIITNFSRKSRVLYIKKEFLKVTIEYLQNSQ